MQLKSFLGTVCAAALLATGVADLAREVVTHTYSGGDLLL